MITFKEFLFYSPNSILVLYMLICGGYIANLFGCRVQYLLSNNMVLKHLLGFMTMYFFVVVTRQETVKPNTHAFLAALFYIIFVITTRMDYKWWFAFIIGLFVIYILEAYKTNDKIEEEKKKQIEYYQKYLIYIVAVIILLGFIIYYGKKKAEYGSDFDHFTFLIGRTNCLSNTPFNMNDADAFMNAFVLWK